jgi:hypothetical protein
MNISIKKNIIIENPETKSFLADAYFKETFEKLPLVVFAHGYKGYKDWGAWDLMGEKFAEAGFYFVKFNFSHNGTTLENPKEFGDLEAFGMNNFSKEMSDFKAVLDYFLKDENVDTENVSIIGHSRGGGIAVIEAFEDDRVKNLITFAGVSNFKYRFPRDERFEKWKNDGVMYSENMRTHQQMPHYFQYYEDFVENEDRFTIQRAAQNLKKPYLIVQGTNDDAVKDKEAFLLHEWCRTSELLIVENANHVFGSKEPWTSNELPKDLGMVINHTVDFINNN